VKSRDEENFHCCRAVFYGFAGWLGLRGELANRNYISRLIGHDNKLFQN
jgi:hypothetical protein